MNLYYTYTNTRPRILEAEFEVVEEFDPNLPVVEFNAQGYRAGRSRKKEYERYDTPLDSFLRRVFGGI